MSVYSSVGAADAIVALPSSTTLMSNINTSTPRFFNKPPLEQQQNSFRSILDQFSDISRYANVIANKVSTNQLSPPSAENAAITSPNNVMIMNDESVVQKTDAFSPLITMNAQQHQASSNSSAMPASNSNQTSSSPSASSLSDVLSSLMGLSEEEWRTLRDSMRFLHTTTTPASAASLSVPFMSTPSSLSSHLSPEDVLAGFEPALNSDGMVVEPWLTLLPLIYWLLIILGVVGNSIVILVYIFGRQWRSDLSVYLVNLAVADAMLAIFCLPFTMNQVIEHEWPYSDWMCDLVFYLQLASVLSSVYTLVVIGVDRYMFIIYQKKNRRMSKTTKLLVIIIGWLVTFSVCTVQIFVADVHAVVDERTGRVHRSCSENLGNMNVAYTMAIFLITYAIPLVVLASAYYMVGRKLSQMMSEVPDDSSPGAATAATGSQNWSNNNIPATVAGAGTTAQNAPYNMAEERPRPAHVATPMLPGKKFGAAATSVAAACAATYGQPVRQAARIPPHRLQFLRLDPRYNICRTPEMKRIRQKRRIVRMLVVLVILFAISWLPLHSFFLLFTFFEHWFHTATPSNTTASRLDAELIQLVFIPSHVLAMSSCCVNPIVYCFMSRRFRNDLVKLYHRAVNSFTKAAKKACCYCCTRDESDYWSHASSFHVVGAVMDEDDGSYAICTTCKDHQHHNDSNHHHDEHSKNSIKMQSVVNVQHKSSDSMLPNGSVQGLSRATAARSSAASSFAARAANGRVIAKRETRSLCDAANNDSASTESAAVYMKNAPALRINGDNNHTKVEQQSSQEHDLFMASYPLKLSHKDFVKLFSKPIDHKMIRQLSGSINWSRGPISTAGRSAEAASDIAPDAKNSKTPKASIGGGGADSAVIISEKNPMACFYMCTTCGHLYPVFTNKMPSVSSLGTRSTRGNKSPSSEKCIITTTSGRETQSTASTRLALFGQAHPSSITHSVSSSSHHRPAIKSSAASNQRGQKPRYNSHNHDNLLRTSSLTFPSKTDPDCSSSSTAGGTHNKKRDCSSCVIGGTTGGSSSLASSGGASSCTTAAAVLAAVAAAAPRVVLERCSSTRTQSSGNRSPSMSATFRLPLLPQDQRLHQIRPILLKKQCSACKYASNVNKKMTKTNGKSKIIGHAVSSTTSSNRNGCVSASVVKPQKTPKELYD